MRRFSVSVRKISLSKFVFFEDVNLLGRATHEHYKNLPTLNSNDSTVFPTPDEVLIKIVGVYVQVLVGACISHVTFLLL